MRILNKLVFGGLVGLGLLPLGLLTVWALGEGWHFPHLWPKRWSSTAFLQIFSGKMGESLWLSTWISTCVAVFATAFGYITGHFVSHHPLKKWLLRLAYLPFVSSPVILATCLLFLFIKIQLVGTILGVILAQWMFAFSFAIVFFVPFWSPQMKAIEELVYTLGGTALQAMRHVLWPMSIAALRMCFFQTFLISWVQYGITLMVGGGEIQTLPVLVYFYVNEANITFAAMASLVLMLPAFILMTVNRRHVWRD
ncbi:MAG TPA: ABC transporter permease subunit [Rhodothermales bacterium]|nr:ABC transporter permease subunit [Rhodothermales bacterium]HRR09180.1 ABC transporter permease subunit [Rhodothermales bacterium]